MIKSQSVILETFKAIEVFFLCHSNNDVTFKIIINFGLIIIKF
jgi:hypothetical protein